MTTTELVYHPLYSQLSLPVRHRFPIGKYQSLYQALCDAGVSESRFTESVPVSQAQLSQVFVPGYVDALFTGSIDAKAMRRIGFPWSQQLIRRTCAAVGGTITAAKLALKSGRAINLTGGYHHAFADYGSGFCLINDLYLAALQLLSDPYIARVLIIDCDVHQGDGTAKLAEARRDIITLSLHGEKNFPYRKQQSNMDIPLAKGTGDEEYMDALDTALDVIGHSFQPDAVIYDAGVDVHTNDDLGHLNISTAGLRARDTRVFEFCQQRGLPVVAVIGGGYQRDMTALTELHLQLFKAASVIA